MRIWRAHAWEHDGTTWTGVHQPCPRDCVLRCRARYPPREEDRE